MKIVNEFQSPGGGAAETSNAASSWLSSKLAALFSWIGKPAETGVCEVCGAEASGDDGRCDKHFRVI